VARTAQEVRRVFKVMYGKDLVQMLDSETSGNYHRLCLALLRNVYERDAYWLRKAMKGLGTDEGCLIEILVTRERDHLKEVKRAFAEMYEGRDLEKDIISETSGHFQRLLVALCTANRPVHGAPIDQRKCHEDAQALYKAGEGRWGTDESKFNAVLCARSVPQLRCIFDEYDKISKNTIERAIEKEMSGNLKTGMLTIGARRAAPLPWVALIAVPGGDALHLCVQCAWSATPRRTLPSASTSP